MDNKKFKKPNPFPGVSNTLLIPLYSRSCATKQVHNFEDPKALELIKILSVSNNQLKIGPILKNACIFRAKIIDQFTNDLLEKNKINTIVGLGAGLCTRHYRLKDSPKSTIDIDFHEVNIRKQKLIRLQNNHHLIDSDILDDKWISLVKSYSKGPFCFILEGVSMYLQKNDIIALVKLLTNNFPKSHLLFDFVHPIIAKNSHFLPAISNMNMKFQFGITNLDKLNEWLGTQNVEILGQKEITNELCKKTFGISLLKFLPKVLWPYSIGHIKL